MKPYRICCLDIDGRVSLAFDLVCRDDLAALTEGESVCEGSAVEVWDGRRLVARIKADNAPLTAQDHECL
jgi:hypothetical protein